MTTDEELRLAAESLGESVLVVGAGPTGAVAVDRVSDRPVPATDEAADPDAVVLAVDGSAPDSSLPDSEEVPAVPLSIAVVSLPARPTPDERELLETLGGLVDAVVLTPSTDTESLTDAVATFVSVVRDPGFVNLDLADARTVLADVDLAALGVGTSDRGSPADAVAEAFTSLPAGVETDPA
ncbi:MAG: cell division protein FtsZ, partial [Natronomonas sp.]